MRPKFFISSFSTEDGRPIGDIRETEDELFELRRRLFELGQKHNSAIWVAEQSLPRLGQRIAIERVNKCLKEIEGCTHVVVILAGRRAGSIDHGTAFEEECAASYLELEWLYAIASRKPILVFQFPGFRPGPRLAFLLESFGVVNPIPARAGEIVQMMTLFIEQPHRLAAFARTELSLPIASLYGNRGTGWERHEQTSVFLRGMKDELEGGVNISHVHRWMDTGEKSRDPRDRLVWYWAAYRELMRQGGDDEELLPMHEKVLSKWSAAASWCGLHAHIYLGALAAVFTYDDIRKRMRNLGLQPLPGGSSLPAHGAYASAYHSLSKLCPSGTWEARRFGELAVENIRQAIDAQIDDESVLRSFFGVILLVQGRSAEAGEQAQKAHRALVSGPATTPSRRGSVLCDIGATLAKVGGLRNLVRAARCISEGAILLEWAALQGDGSAADFQRRNLKRLKALAMSSSSEVRRMFRKIYEDVRSRM